MRNMFTRLWADESGASAAEYALILAVVGAAIATAAVGLAAAIEGEIAETTKVVADS